ncbi:MAG: hypothetical protein J6Y65_04740, partial [Eggerthellaceae bacterium]|nr:hypothetical protein [Eggerthellaceae bacterium]
TFVKAEGFEVDDRALLLGSAMPANTDPFELLIENRVAVQSGHVQDSPVEVVKTDNGFPVGAVAGGLGAAALIGAGAVLYAKHKKDQTQGKASKDEDSSDTAN